MNLFPLLRLAFAVSVAVILGGCATVQSPDPRDPWEGFNRRVYTVNDAVDRAVLKPFAQAYQFVTPTPVRSCVSNMFSNLGDVWSAANSFLQGRGLDGINNMGRFMFNTTMGVGGCFDVATNTGATKNPNDFGITLGVWGASNGPYVVLPILGPSTVRDGVGFGVGVFGNPTSLTRINDVPWRNSLLGLWAVNTRSNLLETTNTIDRVALDPYSFVRDAYLQRRAAQVRRHSGAGEVDLPDYSDVEDDTVVVPAPTTAQPAPATATPPRF
jgi:phospholipid-binding lipoprotein MlaA